MLCISVLKLTNNISCINKIRVPASCYQEMWHVGPCALLKVIILVLIGFSCPDYIYSVK